MACYCHLVPYTFNWEMLVLGNCGAENLGAWKLWCLKILVLGNSTSFGAWESFGGILAPRQFGVFNYRNDTTLRISCSSILGFGGSPRIEDFGVCKLRCLETLVLENLGAWKLWCWETIWWDFWIPGFGDFQAPNFPNLR